VRRERLVSLDVFRGLTVAGMLLVNNPGSWSHIYWLLEHADWHGCTPTDLVFPFFLFIVGVAIPFSQARRAESESRRQQLLHIVVRGARLVLLGLLLAAIPNPVPVPEGFVMLRVVRFAAYAFIPLAMLALLIPWKSPRFTLLMPVFVAIVLALLLLVTHFVNRSALAHGLPANHNFGGGMLVPWRMRFPGVLQRIGICYAVAAGIALFAGWRVVALSAIAVFTIYSTLMLEVRYPSLVDSTISVAGKLDKDDNLARFVDVSVLRRHAYGAYPDPEGILSTLPAVGTVLLGILAGCWLRRDESPERRCAGLLVLGVFLATLGWILAGALMPLNKPIWTPSYAVYTAGLAALGLGCCYWFVDILGWRRVAKPFQVYGLNAIAAFVLAGVLARVMSMIRFAGEGSASVTLKGWFVAGIDCGVKSMFGADSALAGANNLSLYFALCFVLAVLAVMWLLYAMKIFVKI